MNGDAIFEEMSERSEAAISRLSRAIDLLSQLPAGPFSPDAEIVARMVAERDKWIVFLDGIRGLQKAEASGFPASGLDDYLAELTAKLE